MDLYQLTTVVLPDSVESIDRFAISNCYNLRTLVIGKNFKSCYIDFYKLIDLYDLSDKGNFSFAVNVHKSLYEPLSTVTDSDGYVFLEKDDEVFLVGYEGESSTLTFPQSFNGKNYSLYEYAFTGSQGVTNVVLPDCIKTIPNSAFMYSAIQNFTMSNSVTYIDENAFKYCTSLAELTFSENVTDICREAFLGCSSLKSIDLGKKLISLYYNAFQSCTSLEKVTLPSTFSGLYGREMFLDCDGLEEVVYSEGIEDTGDAIFKSCDNLKKVFLPKTIEKIDNATFYNCSKLEIIVYNSTIADWKLIEKDYQWNSGTGEYVIVCLDGTISKDNTIRYN